MTSVLTSFRKSEYPNFIAINNYKNTVQQRLEDLEARTCEAIDETPAEEQAELIDDQLSQFHLQVDDLCQEKIHIIGTHANITPMSTSQPVTANLNSNSTSLTLKRDVQPMSVSTQPTMKKITEDNRPNWTTSAQPQRPSTIIKQMQQATRRIDKGHCQNHPQSIQLRIPPQITMEYHLVIRYTDNYGELSNHLLDLAFCSIY